MSLEDRKRNYDIKMPYEVQMNAMWDLLIAIADNTGTEVPESAADMIEFMAKVKAKYPK